MSNMCVDCVQLSASDESESAENDAHGTNVTPGETMNADPNIMNRDADECTGLNSDEDPDLRDEPEDDDDDEDDDWEEDWDIGALSDEDSDEELTEIPDSTWSSVASNKRLMSDMRDSGWEYGTLCCIYST